MCFLFRGRGSSGRGLGLRGGRRLADRVLPMGPVAPPPARRSPWVVKENQHAFCLDVAEAAHDIHLAPAGEAPFATAAFDFAAADPVVLAAGVRDWLAFLSHEQAHVHAQLPAMPLSWGGLGWSPQPHQPADATAPHESPITIWLAPILRGGAVRGRAADGGGGDNSTDPAANSFAARAPIKRPSAAPGFLAAAARRRRPASASSSSGAGLGHAPEPPGVQPKAGNEGPLPVNSSVAPARGDAILGLQPQWLE